MRIKKSIFHLLCATVLAAWVTNISAAERTSDRSDQPLKPTIQSLLQYECPEWFRDAKFGVLHVRYRS